MRIAGRFLLHLGRLAGAALLTFYAVHASAQTYPSKPIRMIVGFAPGGTGEFMSRTITPRMGELIGQQFIIDFRGGAGTTLAASLTAAAPADGYTVFIQSLTTQAINHSIYAKLPYDTRKDFASAGLIGMVALVLGAHPSFPARTPKELVALSHARPGTLSYGSAGVGTTSHFTVELFKLASKADLTHIPYKGAGPAMIDTMSGFIPLVADAITSMKPHLDAGKLRGIAISSAQRTEAAPNLATFAESGYPGFEASTWWGILVPVRTPAAIVARLNGELNRALEDGAVRKRMVTYGATIKTGTPEQGMELTLAEIEKWAKVVKATGARVE